MLIEKLRKVVDPEVGVNIVDLGLIYDLKVSGKKAHVKMTLTTPTCPAGGMILSGVEGVLKEEGYEPDIDLTFSPPWTPDMMSKEVKEKFGFLK